MKSGISVSRHVPIVVRRIYIWHAAVERHCQTTPNPFMPDWKRLAGNGRFSTSEKTHSLWLPE